DRFCSTCNRLRLTAQGKLQLCLSHEDGVDLRKPLREGRSDPEIRELISRGVFQKPFGNRFLENQEPVYQISMSRIGG
ncbi:MAG TPA: GTP 3',8-cyclase MoaA, partial [Nitrospiria bacterium]|nr:GTP 3',8-cyclase MoaA [Nitrospiria bacterium]